MGDRGCVIGVSDREIEAAEALLAEEEGIFVQPDAAASLAGLDLRCPTRAGGPVRAGCVGSDRPRFKGPIDLRASSD